MAVEQSHSVMVIGGGMGGLFTGAILACTGCSVTVLEKNAIVGGGLQSFKRFGVWFNTGMHNFGGFGDKWALSHLLMYLGIKDRLHVLPVDEQAQEIVWTDATHCYRLPRGRKAFEQYLSTHFPNQTSGIHRFLDALYTIADSFDLYYMRRAMAHPESVQYENLTVDQLIRMNIDDEELIRLLSYMTLLCGTSISEAQASVYSMLMVLYIDGEYRFEENALQLAEALKGVIEEHGGKVVSNAEVTSVSVNNAQVECVTTADGCQWVADKYIAAIAPKVLFSILTHDVVRQVSRRRAENYIPDSSALSIYILLKDKSFQFINSTVYLPTEKHDRLLPSYILLSTPPVRNQGEWAHTMEILAPVHYSDFASWHESKYGARPDEYETYKNQLAQAVIEYVSRYYDITSAIDKVNVASPLTIRDFYNSPNGALFSQQGLFMPLKTRTDNLFLTGQSILFHGMCGVPLTAILTAEAVYGKDILTDIIRASEQ